MTLLDHFNVFQAVSKARRFSANARSLYIAILGEFDSLHYPPALKLYNTDLQHLSGINSTSAFDSARNALINAELISHKKQVYSLKDFGNTLETFQKDFRNISEILEKESRNTSETVQKELRNTSERIEKDSFTSISISKESETTTTENTTTTATAEEESRAHARTSLNTNSPEVLKAWEDAKGEKLAGFKAQSLILAERNYGAEKVIAAIKTASESNDYNEYPYVTYRYFKVVLENQAKGGKANDRTIEQNFRTDSVTANYKIDICPDD